MQTISGTEAALKRLVLLLRYRKLFRISVHHQRTAINPPAWTGASDRRQPRAADRRLAFVSISHVSLFAGAALFTTAVVGGSGYLIRELHRQVGVACSTVGLPGPAIEPSPSIVLTEETLHVSSIALGHVPVAVVNGAIATEGDSLEVKTPSGIVTLRITRISDGVVQFKCGGQTISANLLDASPRKGYR